ncbi:MAG: hypothetical protein U0894_13090 [Pirellulales bacterium]
MSAPSVDADKARDQHSAPDPSDAARLGISLRLPQADSLARILLITGQRTTLRLVGLGIDITHHFADQHIPLPGVPFPLD